MEVATLWFTDYMSLNVPAMNLLERFEDHMSSNWLFLGQYGNNNIRYYLSERLHGHIHVWVILDLSPSILRLV